MGASELGDGVRLVGDERWAPELVDCGGLARPICNISRPGLLPLRAYLRRMTGEEVDLRRWRPGSRARHAGPAGADVVRQHTSPPAAP